jgi:hypothetical protein
VRNADAAVDFELGARALAWRRPRGLWDRVAGIPELWLLECIPEKRSCQTGAEKALVERQVNIIGIIGYVTK